MPQTLILATRKSPLALVQAEMVSAHLKAALGADVRLLAITTTGDRQAGWSLEGKGGKGLFTGELEHALLRGEAFIAVHSAKDLPGENTAGLTVAGYLPRADVRDVLVARAGVTSPARLATGSPRRRQQLAARHPGAAFCEIRGNVDTRLRKIAGGEVADATVLAAAGLARLGIASWEGLEFRPIEVSAMVPAVGQGAIAIQCRAADAPTFAPLLDKPTARSLGLERALQAALGGGCHTAFGAYATPEALFFYHEKTGMRRIALASGDLEAPVPAAARILKELGLP